MPILGFGVYQIPPEQTENAVADALAAGYRSLDTAAAYGNEEAVGHTIESSGIPREELFVTTELWAQDNPAEANTKRAFDTSLRELGPDHNEITPAVNQIETHPFHQRTADQDLLRERGLQIESWGPFAEDRNDLFTHPVLSEIGAAHGKSVAQVVLRRLVQRDVVVIPKSVRGSAITA